MHVQEYDDIPLEMIGKNILEIGVNQKRILSSRLKSKILEGNYLGIDIEPRPGPLNVIQANIWGYDLRQKFDTILIISVLEHIELCDWDGIIKKLMDSLNPGGYLIAAVPYKQKLRDYVYSTDYNVSRDQLHTIFGIDRKVMLRYFPHAQIKIIKRIWWRQDGANVIWATFRFLKRLFFGESPIKRNIMVFWRREKTTLFKVVD